MRILLDTCTFLWLAANLDKIPKTVRDLVEDSDNTLHVSVASAWEIAMKYKRDQLRLPSPPELFVSERMAVYDMTVVNIVFQHAIRAGSLPFHHKDPFDRMLIAQAEIEGLTIATPDAAFSPYGVPVVW